MDAINYVEATVAAALTEARTTYDTLHDRSYKFVTLVMGAASAMAVYGLGKVGTDGYLLQLIPLGFWSLYLFWVASKLLIDGAATQQMNVGTTSAKLIERIHQHEKDKSGEQAQHEAVISTRWDQVASIDQQILDYSKGATRRGLAIDIAYKRTAKSPIFGLFGYAVALSYQAYCNLVS